MSVNGFLQLDGQKMSTSKGNVYTLRQICDMHGADATRLTLMYGGEGLEDPNWDSEFARNAGPKLVQWYEFAVSNYGRAARTRSSSTAGSSRSRSRPSS